MRPALVAQMAVTTVLGTVLASLAAGYVADQTREAAAGAALRALLVTLALLLSSWFAVRGRLLALSRPQLRLGAGVGLLLGYVLSPSTWQGRTYAAQLVTDPGAPSMVLDLVLWVLVGGAAVLLASAPASRRERPSYT
ncbi:hypothetical protein [Cellulomonas sp. B6]|uniref:hypothetical protein n=1 Tax=Cellulomonas sp. B6 TaxID=1295626 RepID=UPI000AF0E5C0|nr:hypothetical protein [Cellulomonas sp. B6]